MPTEENLRQCQWCRKFFYPTDKKFNCCSKECKEKLVNLVRQNRVNKGRGEREHGTVLPYLPIPARIIPTTEKLNTVDSVPGFSANWKEISREIRKRDNYTCQFCLVILQENSSELHAHHIIPRRKLKGLPYEIIEHPHNLITLCSSCHPNVEQGFYRLPEELVERAYAAVKTHKK